MTTPARILSWILGAGLLAGAIVWWLWPIGFVRVTVTNRGRVPLHSVLIRVTGNQYALGTLPPGAEVATRVAPRGESHVEVDWRTPDEEVHTAVVDCYFEDGYGGTVDVDLDGAVVARKVANIRLGP